MQKVLTKPWGFAMIKPSEKEDSRIRRWNESQQIPTGKWCQPSSKRDSPGKGNFKNSGKEVRTTEIFS